MATLGKSWEYHRFEPWWQIEHRDLAYIHEPFNDAETETQWRQQGWTQSKFTGDLYDMRFAMPDMVEFFYQELPLTNLAWSFYRMSTGTILPEHSDTFRRYKDIYAVVDIQQITRFVVFLEDWSSGHYFEIDGHPIVKWQAGDAVSWAGDVTHLAANLGRDHRYTLQLTGMPLTG